MVRKKDTLEVLDQAFDMDWNSSKVTKFIKNENVQKETHGVFRKYYYQFKETYKYYSSLNPIGILLKKDEVWCIQAQQFSDLIKRINMIDKSIQEADVNLKWTSTLAGNAKHKNNPDRGLVRYILRELYLMDI